MTSVYLLWDQDLSEVEGVFSTLEKAQEQTTVTAEWQERESSNGFNWWDDAGMYCIQEMVLDVDVYTGEVI
jgi:hypothetical protein